MERDLDSGLLKELEAKVTEIRTYLAQAESDGWTLNEADTERIIISPLLGTLGYSPTEIRQRGHDSVVNSYPDYELLPTTSQKWFLEAKKLDHALADGEAAQAVNYANNKGAEWAVLTNGRKWYIYNAHLPKPLSEKRVFQIDDLFKIDSTLEILGHLSRPSMISGGLTRAWTISQIMPVIAQQLDTPNSEIRKHLLKIATKQPHLTICDATIGEALATLSYIGHGKINIAAEPPSINFSPTQQVVVNTRVSVHELAEIATNCALCTHKKVTCLYFADGKSKAVTCWADATTKAISAIVEQFGMPALPLSNRPRGKSYFLNTQPVHSTGISMKAYRTVSAGNTTIYVDINRSAQELMRALLNVCQTLSVPSDFVKIAVGS